MAPKVTKTSVIAFNLPSKRKVITLEFRNIDINTCPRNCLVSKNLSNNSSFDLSRALSGRRLKVT